MDNNSCIIYYDFLIEKDNKAIYEHAVSIKDRFKASNVINKNAPVVNEGTRKSKVTSKNNFNALYTLLTDQIKPLIPEVMAKLNVEPFEYEDIEVHLTAHNDGDFYKPHRDNNQGDVKARALTFVYYFNSVPKMFTGGQLLFLENKPKPFIYEPVNNSIVFFNSSLLHAVHPVSCPSKQFEHSRFTLNGWIRKK